jgi:hypothetical protein
MENKDTVSLTLKTFFKRWASLQVIVLWCYEVVLCLSKHHTMKMWSGSVPPCILNLSTRWRWVVSFTPQPLYLWRKKCQYPLCRRLGGPQS